jgi:hypothetical protein
MSLGENEDIASKLDFGKDKSDKARFTESSSA